MRCTSLMDRQLARADFERAAMPMDSGGWSMRQLPYLTGAVWLSCFGSIYAAVRWREVRGAEGRLPGMGSWIASVAGWLCEITRAATRPNSVRLGAPGREARLGGSLAACRVRVDSFLLRPGVTTRFSVLAPAAAGWFWLSFPVPCPGWVS
ncbi:hypothetical protein CALVIDRAFT_385450 [Calocera viscosa TUFC12733]|uniref:Uncharacterized protein n=1 Tax=Calocera viscosa (strain TUFC12733) TaxID=1330018 RepID=A0A167Q9B9_CALVF|nr:hypothetical protein CALVIDRAFT_385450 [Calocera viscosa TUFC12733]